MQISTEQTIIMPNHLSPSAWRQWSTKIQTNDRHLHSIAAKAMWLSHQTNTIGAVTSGTQAPKYSVYQAHYFSNTSKSPIYQSHQKMPLSLQQTQWPTRSKWIILTTCVKTTSRHCTAWNKYSNELLTTPMKCRTQQKQFCMNWCEGPTNRGDYVTKHHATVHHQNVIPVFITLLNTIKILQKITKAKFLILPSHTKLTARVCLVWELVIPYNWDQQGLSKEIWHGWS